jgi:hypothetical protein
MSQESKERKQDMTKTMVLIMGASLMLASQSAAFHPLQQA